MLEFSEPYVRFWWAWTGVIGVFFSAWFTLFARALWRIGNKKKGFLDD